MSTELSYPWAEPPAAGTLHPVAEGVRWLRMPLPFALDHINLWVLDDADGAAVSLVDTGIATDSTKAVWDALFAGPLAATPPARVICTHFHPDHMGLAGWLCGRFGIPLWATLAEWAFGQMLSQDVSDAYVETQVTFYRRAGFEAQTLDVVRARKNPYAPRVSPIPKSVRRLIDGEKFTVGGRSWEVVVGRGHAPEHAALYCADLGVLISGDQVLPRISPNVSVWPQEPEANPLGLFLDSLRTIKQRVPADVLVLPSHGRPFKGLHTRIDELIAHHADRLDDCLAACADGPKTGMDILPVLFRRELDDHQTMFAIGESLAHLHALVADGRLVRSLDADGIWRFSKAG